MVRVLMVMMSLLGFSSSLSLPAEGSYMAEETCRQWGEWPPNLYGGYYCTLQWACTDGSGGSYGGTDPSLCSRRG